MKRITFINFITYLFFAFFSVRLSAEIDCAGTNQKRAQPLPSKYDTGWFTDEPPVPKDLPKSPEPFMKGCWEVQCYELFDEIKKLKNIPFNYPADGCYARAHFISKYLEDKGFLTGKVFVEGDLRVDTKNDPDGFVKWKYHVAPTIQVISMTGVYTMVIDPSLFDKPVSIDEWVKIQTKHNPEQKDLKVYLKKRFDYMRSDERDSWSEDDLKDAREDMERFRKMKEQELKDEEIRKQTLKHLKQNYKKKYGVDYEPSK